MKTGAHASKKASEGDAKTGLFHTLLLEVLRRRLDQGSILKILKELRQHLAIRVVGCRILISFSPDEVKRFFEQLTVLHTVAVEDMEV